MKHSGELVSLSVAILWTVSAVLSEVASKRMGEAAVNVWRMLMAIGLLYVLLMVTGSTTTLTEAPPESWCWLLASGLVGYTFGDYCLFNAYTLIGSRFAQLFMTLAPPFAALAAWLTMGEALTWKSMLGMVLTVAGIGMSIVGRPSERQGGKASRLRLPWRGIVLGIGAGLGQGIGLVLSKKGLLSMGDAAMAPAAGTIMRGVAGLAGFVVLLFLRNKQHTMRACLGGRNMLLLLSLAIFGPAVGVTLSLWATQLTAVGVAQTIMAITPVLILVPSYFIFRQRITLREVVGAVVSVMGVALFFI